MPSEPTSAAAIPFRRLLLMPWRWNRWMLGLTLAAAFLIAYGASYSMLAEKIGVIASGPYSTFDGELFEDEPLEFIMEVHYPRTYVLPPVLHEAVKLFFEPAHRIDRWLRPVYWGDGIYFVD